jgi:hypothetical protein
MLSASVEMPGRYPAAIAVMREMTWSWSDLLEAPADLVEEILYRMDRTVHWTQERAKLDEARMKAQLR